MKPHSAKEGYSQNCISGMKSNTSWAHLSIKTSAEVSKDKSLQSGKIRGFLPNLDTKKSTLKVL